MKTRTNIAFNRFSISEKLKIDQIFQNLEKCVYSDETGFGYKAICIEQGVISATLIKRTYTSILGFSPNENDFEKIDIPIFDEISFSLDFNKGLLYTQGAYSNMNKVKSALRISLECQFIYVESKASPAIVLDKLVDSSDYEIEEVVIVQFEYKNGVTGKYIAKIADQTIGREILNYNSNNISKLSLNFYGDNEYYIIIYSNGAITIKCDEDDLFAILENFKERIYG